MCYVAKWQHSGSLVSTIASHLQPCACEFVLTQTSPRYSVFLPQFLTGGYVMPSMGVLSPSSGMYCRVEVIHE